MYRLTRHILKERYYLSAYLTEEAIMFATYQYDRYRAYIYAREWALSRNPLYFNYTGLGGDCTNFVSQCLFAGSCIMNYMPVFGWFYLSEKERSAAWTGVEYLYNFITGNNGQGPFGSETYPGGLELSDVIQLCNEKGVWYHTLIVSGFSDKGYLVAAHTDDAFDRPLDTYRFAKARYIHINGFRCPAGSGCTDCFESLYKGISIIT